MNTEPRIGGLFEGYGGLTMGTQSIFGGRLAWYAENDPAAGAVLAHHQPDVTNLGDVTNRVDWSTVEPVDVLTAGWPCQDISNAGKRAGIEGERSGLWSYVVDACRVLRPRYVLLENVASLVVRGLDTVLADLAALGFDAEWACVPASAVGAPHRRDRWFCVATNADSVGPVRSWDARRRRSGPTDDRIATADPAGDGRHEGRAEPARQLGRHDAAERGHEPRPAGSGDINGDTTEGRSNQELQDVRNPTSTETLRSTPRRSRSFSASEQLFTGVREHSINGRQGHTPLAGQETSEEGMRDLHDNNRSTCSPQGPKSGEQRSEQSGNAVFELPPSPALEGRSRQEADKPQDWGDYEQAIRRWEEILGRPAPPPTQCGTKRSRVLSPAFCEWLMGLPAGHVTNVPGLTRPEQLRLLGNGVVPQQAAAALAHLSAVIA